MCTRARKRVKREGPAPQRVMFARHVPNVLNRRRVRLYAKAVKFEAIHEGVPAAARGARRAPTQMEVTFECVDALQINACVNGNVTRDVFWSTHYPRPRPSQVTMVIGHGIREISNGIHFQAAFNDVGVFFVNNAGLVEEDHWYEITLAESIFGIPPIGVYQELGDDLELRDPENLSLERFELPPGVVVRWLDHVYSASVSDTTPQIAQDNPQVAFVGVLNVGQGGCNALYAADGRPFMYYDFGRAKGSSSRPARMRPCLARAPTVVLSHWDQDHYELGVSFPEARHLPWLCLEGAVGSITGTYYRSLTRARVWAWDERRFEEYSWGFILRAWDPYSNNKNDNGLVALVRLRDDTDAPPIGQRRALDALGTRPEIFPEERYVLLTGDAMYQHIPSCAAHDLDGRVIGINAVHHGSYEGMVGYEDCIPLAADPLHDFPATVTYTYGIHQSTGQSAGGYGHPDREAVEWHMMRGYHHRLNTNTAVGGGPPHKVERNCVLGWRLNPGARSPMQALAIATARGNYDPARTAARQATDQARATWILLTEARRAKGVAGGDLNVLANAVDHFRLNDPGFLALASPATDLDARNDIAAARTALDDDAAVGLFEARDTTAYNAAVVANQAAAVQADLLAQAVATNDPAIARIQQVQCQAPVILPVPMPVLDPVRAPVGHATSAVVAPPTVAVATAISVTERVNAPATLRIEDHGLANGNQVTIAGSAHGGTNGNHNVTVVDADTVTIAVNRGGAPVTENVRVSYAPAGPGPVAVNIQAVANPPPFTRVTHLEHSVHAVAQVTIGGTGRVGLDRAHNATVINANAYSIDAAAPGARAAELAATSSGTRSKEDFKELVTLHDPGASPTRVAHANHRMQSNQYVDVQGNAPGVLRGNRRITWVDANSYTIAASALAVAVHANQIATGTRTRFAFAGEAVSIAVGPSKSRVACVGHGLRDGQWVTITGAPGGLLGDFQITCDGVDHYFIDATAGDLVVHAAQATARPRGKFTNRPASLRDTGAYPVVQHGGHGLANGATVTLANTVHYDGVRTIVVVDANQYAINAATGVNRVNVLGQATTTPGQLGFNGDPVFLRDDGVGQVRVQHANHGLVTGSQVTIAGGSLHGQTLPITRVDPNHYTLAATSGRLCVEGIAVVANGMPVEITFLLAGPTCTVRHGGPHGLANGAASTVAGALEPALNGVHAVTVVSPVSYTIPVVLAADYYETNIAITVAGVRGAPPGSAPPVPIDPRTRDELLALEADRAHVAPNRVPDIAASAVASYEHEIAPATCANTHCAFIDLNRHA